MIRVRGPASPYDPTYHLFARFDKIAEIVRVERPDVLEIHSPYLAALGALRASVSTYGVRTFQWHSDFIDTYAGVLAQTLAARESPLPLARRTMGATARAMGPLTQPLWAMVRALATRCDATLVASRWQADKLEGHGIRNVRRVPFGIERSVFRPEARSVDARRRLLALAGRAGDDGAAVFVGLGRFAIEKRWDVVLDAFARVRAERDAVLVLFGDGPERDRMRARAAPGVVMPGFLRDREELAAMLASADALVHGCPFETFGLSIAEAMSTGLPTVLPDAGGAAEMHDPTAGERYASGDVDDAARAMLRVLDRVATEGASLRANASRIARLLPDVRGQFEAQVELYEALLAERKEC